MPQRARRILLSAFGDPGHAFPAIALGRALRRRGHEVWLETWERWRGVVEGEGIGFAPAPEYPVFPTREHPLSPYDAAARASAVTRRLVREVDPELVVADILTLAAALAAELERRPWASLVPHLLPTPTPGSPPFAIGARPPRTAAGAALWRLLDPLTTMGARRGRDELNAVRARVGLRPLPHLHGGLSQRLALVATFPHLEPPSPGGGRGATHVCGPLLWEQPGGEAELPAGSAPLVLVAPSTSQDPRQRLLTAALEGLAGEPVRVLAALGDRGPPAGVVVPPRARLARWVSYARVMPHCAVVVCHGGHGTVARALACGVPVVVCPAGGDMAETGARVARAGVGVSVPGRLASARGVRLAVRAVLARSGCRARAGELGAWASEHDGGETAAQALETLIRDR